MSSIKALAAIAAAGALGACASSAPITVAPPLSTEAYKIPVNVQAEQLQLTPHAQGLSSNQSAAMYDMIGRWRSAAGGPIVIETSASAGPDARAASGKVGQFLRDYGVAAADIQLRTYQAEAAAPIRVTFPIYEADLPRCGVADDLSRTPNHPPSNFGCAVSANIAAMAANPSDLVYARPEDPIDASRRQQVLDRYRQGAATSSAKEASSSTAGGVN
ncbi:MAG TPA: CpaD family pilus assembly lipoprotein [Caulobacteraceae bacterium]|nr:CpaD family pilus assembly lipoprotein [Caulobacteraceae bacterium]